MEKQLLVLPRFLSHESLLANGLVVGFCKPKYVDYYLFFTLCKHVNELQGSTLVEQL